LGVHRRRPDLQSFPTRRSSDLQKAVKHFPRFVQRVLTQVLDEASKTFVEPQVTPPLQGDQIAEPHVGQLVRNHSGNLVTLKWWRDRKSTRLNSSHVSISYAVFC